MADLASSHICLLEIKFALENGESVRTGLLRALGKLHDPFARGLRKWLFDLDQGSAKLNEDFVSTIYQRSLLRLLKYGLAGRSIRQQVTDLESEMNQACHEQMEEFLRLLPMQMSIPVLLLQFPAFLLLLLGPLIGEMAFGLK